MTPINLRPHEVRAYLAGTKTEFRRVMRPQPPEDYGQLECDFYTPTVIGRDGEEREGKEIFGVYTTDGEWGIKSPFGGPGNVLYGRETWKESDDEYGCPVMAYRAGGHCLIGAEGDKRKGTWREFLIPVAVDYQPGEDDGPWRSPMHMPQWAARIWLEVVSVRAEQVQAITDADAVKEMDAEEDWYTLYQCPACGHLDHDRQDGTGHVEQGTAIGWDMEGPREPGWSYWLLACSRCGLNNDMRAAAPSIQFAAQFERDNGKGTWQANPFVWVVTTKPTHPPGR